MDESSSKKLSADDLARDFGIRSPLTRKCLVRLYEAIVREKDAYSRWRELFSRLWGPAESRLLEPLRVLMRKIGIPPSGQPLPVLFALQTHYALLMSLLVKRYVNLRRYEIIAPAFAWCLEADSPELRSAIGQIAEKMGEYELRSTRNSTPASDLLKHLHHSLFPRPVRHHLGEYYTPDWMAEHLLDQLEFDGQTAGRLLDPACGSGTFLMAAIRRIRKALSAPPSPTLVGAHEAPRVNAGAKHSSPSPPLPCLDAILESVVGIDLNPLAVMAARANYLIAIHDLLPENELIEIPVYCGDSILGLGPNINCGAGVSPALAAGTAAPQKPFDCIAGNPPWIAWDNLPEDYREATKPLWEKYGLFSLSGNAARHGGGKKDLSMLMLYAAADRYLKPGGRLGFVITQTLFQTKGAGDGFRRFRLGNEGDFLKVLRVDDLTAIKPFDDAANWTSAIVLEKGSPTVYPVNYVRWHVGQVSKLSQNVGRASSLSKNVGQVSNLSAENRQVGNLSYEKQFCTASPIDPLRPTSPWLVQPVGNDSANSSRIIPSPADYRAYLGANSGGANGVYWVEAMGAAEGGVRIRNLAQKGKKQVECVERIVEPDLIYPLLRWSDLARYAPLPRYHILLVQDCERRVGLEEARLKREFPLTHAYLREFEDLLTSRAAYRRYQSRQPFYSMYNVGPYTAADYKVVWRRMDKRLSAAVVEPVEHPLLGRKPVVPQETCVLIACGSAEEAHYLCAMLNSESAGRLIDAHSVRGGKGFGTPSILDYLPLRRHDPGNSLHRALADYSRKAHCQPSEANMRESVQKDIDRLAEEAFVLQTRSHAPAWEREENF